MARCPECDEIKSDGPLFCAKYGTELIIDPTCPTCGKKYENDPKFCKLDGSKLVSANKLTPTCPKGEREFAVNTKISDDGLDLTPSAEAVPEEKAPPCKFPEEPAPPIMAPKTQEGQPEVHQTPLIPDGVARVRFPSPWKWAVGGGVLAVLAIGLVYLLLPKTVPGPKETSQKTVATSPAAPKDQGKPLAAPVHPPEQKPSDLDDWVFVGSSDGSIQYYNSSSIKIDKQKKIIKVWVKDVYTEKMEKSILDSSDNINRQKLIDLHYGLALILLDYKGRKCSYNRIIFYDKSDYIIVSQDILPKWTDIIPNSMNDILIKLLYIQYKIQQ